MMNNEKQIEKLEVLSGTKSIERNEQKKTVNEQKQRLKTKMSKINHKLAVISGKCGVDFSRKVTDAMVN